MNERGQVFTLDMFFALTLTALMVSYSGLAFEQARRQTEAYSLRYSLERTANDAADVLLKTYGMPDNWWKDTDTLGTLGLAEENGENPVPNTIDIKRFGQFRRLINADNWSYPANANAVTVIKKLFGGSEHFQVRILDEYDNELWRAFPGWSIGENSGAENSADVVVVRRLVAVRYGTTVRADTGRVYMADAGAWENLIFWVYPSELTTFDFYVILTKGGTIGNSKIEVNHVVQGNGDYLFQNSDADLVTFPSQHGGIYGYSLSRGVQLYESDEYPNSLGMNLAPNPAGWIRVYVVAIPHCSDWGDASMFIEALPATLEVKMWR